MTRINVIPPAELTDAHLLAEYRELPRVFSLALEACNRQPLSAPDDARLVRATIPPAYTMGTGHVRFFYARTRWLSRRQSEIIAECLSRGFAIAHTTAPDPVPGLDDDWTPDDDARAANLARLNERLAERPGWYTHRGTKVGADFYGGAL